MNETANLGVYDTMSANKAVLKNALPAIAAMMMQLFYNLADTFFIGLTRDDLQVAAVSIAFHVFMIFMALSTVFGIGGTSVISRALGEGRNDYAKKVSAFCMWAGVTVGVAVSAAFYIFMDGILRIIGANPDIHKYTRDYMMIVSASGPAILISGTFSNILRADGQPTKAMMGMVLGNLLNIALDPVMILGFGWGIRGAAIATVIGNAAGAAYYLLYFRHGSPNISIDPRDLTRVGETSVSVLSIGVPAALGPMLMSVSQVVMNSLMSDYGSLAVAAAGIASKTTMIIGTVAIGIGQGVQPLLGYSVGARNWKRYRQYMKSSLLFALTVCLIMTVFCCFFARDIAGTFLSEPDSFSPAVTFVYILQSTAFLFGIFYCFANALQAMGAATQSLIVNVSRQGLIYIPALFALRALFGMNGLILAQPLADISSLVLAVVLHGVAFRRLETFYPVLRNKNTSVRDE